MELTAGTTRLVIDESLGARVASLLVPGPGGAGPDGAGPDGAETGLLQLSGRYQPSPHGWGAFPMAPWAGRVRDATLRWDGHEYPLPANKPPHAIHGLVSVRAWDVVSAGPSSALLRCAIGEPWPWPATATLQYDLAPGQLTTVLSVSADAQPMPAWCGIHPWFPRQVGGADVTIDLQAGAMLETADGGIPTGAHLPVPVEGPVAARVDDTFADVTWPVTLTWGHVARLEVTADTSWAVIFTQRDEAVCVEPQTAPPDAANLGLAPTIEPGSPLSMTMQWRWDVLG